MGRSYEMNSFAMIIHIEFHKDWFRHSKVDRENTHTQRQQGKRAWFYFFQSKKSRLITYTRRAILLKAQFRMSFKIFKHPLTCSLWYDVQYTCDILLETLQIFSIWNCKIPSSECPPQRDEVRFAWCEGKGKLISLKMRCCISTAGPNVHTLTETILHTRTNIFIWRLFRHIYGISSAF